MSVPNYGTNNYRVLFVSDEAWTRLVDTAIDCEYITRKSFDQEATCKLRGMHVFIRDLLESKLYDTRPLNIREQDEPLKLAGYTGEWQRYTPRKKRKVKVTDDTLIHASAHALILGIATRPPNHLLGAPSVTESVRCLSLILEAFGTGWISNGEHNT